MIHVGLGKTLFHSSAASIARNGEITLALSERLLRKKATGVWPERAIRALNLQGEFHVAENGDVHRPGLREEGMNRAFPFYEHLRASGLGAFSRALNPSLEFVTHHMSHACAALMLSPFEKCLIVVMDGAGTRASDFPAPVAAPGPDFHEELTVYAFDRARSGMRLECVDKRWRRFEGALSDGAGIFYETAARHIFNCTRSAGKVMGLAPLGRAGGVPMDRVAFLRGLPEERAFRGRGRDEWEAHPSRAEFADLAATAQALFEEDLGEYLKSLRARLPEYGNLILTGGCALNCTFNGKLARSCLFDEVYVPPFPGDECIGMGAAAHAFLSRAPDLWRPVPHDGQHGYFGPLESVPTEARVRAAFGEGFRVEKPADLPAHVARVLSEGHVVAWFQGRSESGPRALGHRSLLVRPDRPGVKDFLNSRIKFRESFRPYGASAAFEKAHEYFDVPIGFSTPFMSFACPTRAEYREQLAEITHVDRTCRYQSVRPGQDRRFYELLQAFGRETGLYCLLNTSLNVMGEPIVESPDDARDFLVKMGANGPVHGLAIGDFYVRMGSV